MSILHVRIVDFDLQLISYPLVLSDLSLELGKAIEISPQHHVISAENSSMWLGSGHSVLVRLAAKTCVTVSYVYRIADVGSELHLEPHLSMKRTSVGGD